MLGYPDTTKFDASMTLRDKKSLIGESISLPCIGTILFSVFLSSKGKWWDPEKANAVYDTYDSPLAIGNQKMCLIF